MKRIFVALTICVSMLASATCFAAITSDYIEAKVYERYPNVNIFAMGELMNEYMEVYAIDVRFHNNDISGQIVFDYNDGHIISENIERH